MGEISELLILIKDKIMELTKVVNTHSIRINELTKRLDELDSKDTDKLH